MERTGKDMIDDAERQKTPTEEAADLRTRVATLEDRLGVLESQLRNHVEESSNA